jgi:hypothetical protein
MLNLRKPFLQASSAILVTLRAKGSKCVGIVLALLVQPDALALYLLLDTAFFAQPCLLLTLAFLLLSDLGLVVRGHRTANDDARAPESLAYGPLRR